MTTKENWIDHAKHAYQQAYVPYSEFPVGAAIVTKSGKVYEGCNIENASFGLTNCAERTAIFKAISEGEKEFEHLVVVGNTKEPISPCGACRQVLVEFCEPDMPITLCNLNGDTKETTMQELLPYSFVEVEK